MDIFKQVIEAYIIDAQNFNKKVVLHKNATLKEFRECCIKGINDIMQNISEKIGILPEDNGSSAYLSLIVQIKTYFPDLNNIYLSNLESELTQWIFYIQKAVDNDEIRSDINILFTAKSFISIFTVNHLLMRCIRG
ncbi:hypothetical protein [Prevotella histicola]|uniref:hypothetical protein n=1 Tax=Prevotella histicola TaxID=470565 RepID=UPI00242CB66B|nr:hypothetical protein [Prevotella histicola]